MVASRIPAISVVVASASSEKALERCLESIEPADGFLELIVATELEREAAARVASRFPFALFHRRPRGTGVFRLRTLGIEEAHGPLVGLLEDHCTALPGWAAAMVSAHRDGHTVLGGPVDNGLTGTSWDWALYFCEYGALMPPLPTGPPAILLAANAAYDRRALEGCRSVWQDAFFDNEVLDALVEAGHRPHLVAEARVESRLRMSPRQAARHLFDGGKRYAGYRRSRVGWRARRLLAVFFPVLPLLLLSRLTVRVATRRPARLPTLLASLPALACQWAMWSAGEAVGTLRPLPAAATRAVPQGG